MSKHADEGTIAHQLAELCLKEQTPAAAYIGRLLESQDYQHAGLSPSNAARWMACPGSHALEADVPFVERSFALEVTEDMAEHVQVYVDFVNERVQNRKLTGAVEVELFIEKKISIEALTGETGATGTGDAVIVSTYPDGTAVLDLIDLKFGRGVEVEAEDNEQLQIYALGVMHEWDLVYDFTRVCVVIHQPRLSREPKEWETNASAVKSFGLRVQSQAKRATALKAKWAVLDASHVSDLPLAPGDKQCRFCKAKGICPMLWEEVAAVVFEEELASPNAIPDALPRTSWTAASEELLGAAMRKAELVEMWLTGVRAEVERRLLQGEGVPGFKLVQGRKGARAWEDKEEAEQVMKSMRLKQDEMYESKLISPTTAEKILKDSPKKWGRLSSLITQSNGVPSVAPVSDKRPALVITPLLDDFDNLTEEKEDASK